MAGMMNLVGHAAIGLEEAPRPYRRWHSRGFKVASLEASARPPPCAHHSKSGTSRSVRIPKSIELLEDQSYG